MIYTIKQGKHAAQLLRWPVLHTGTRSKQLLVTFSAQCWYQDPDWERDWNKLYGWSYGFLPRKVNGIWQPAHHWNSDRLVWRPSQEPQLIEIGYYAYRDGYCDYSVSKLQDVWTEHATVLTLDVARVEWGYVLHPYHGGTHPAPQTYTIDIEEL